VDVAAKAVGVSALYASAKVGDAVMHVGKVGMKGVGVAGTAVATGVKATASGGCLATSYSYEATMKVGRDTRAVSEYAGHKVATSVGATAQGAQRGAASAGKWTVERCGEAGQFVQDKTPDIPVSAISKPVEAIGNAIGEATINIGRFGGNVFSLLDFGDEPFFGFFGSELGSKAPPAK